MNATLNEAVPKIAFIYNPVSGKGSAYRLCNQFKSELSGKWEIVLFRTNKGTTIQDVASICRNGFNRILVAGGDGTLHDVINGIFISGANPFLGIIPVGTGNDLAREAGLFEKFRNNRRAYLKSLSANLLNPDYLLHTVLSLNNELFFSNYLGVGFDGAIIREFNIKRFVNLPNRLIYFFCVIKTLLKGYYYKISIPGLMNKSNTSLHKKIKQLLVLNISSYAGGLINIEKRRENSEFRVIIFEEISELLNFLLEKKIHPLLLKLVGCYKKPLSFTLNKLIVDLLSTPPVQVDGEDHSGFYGKYGTLNIRQAGTIRIISP